MDQGWRSGRVNQRLARPRGNTQSMVCSTVIDPSGWTVAVASMALTSDSTDKGDSSRGSAPATLPAGSAAATVIVSPTAASEPLRVATPSARAVAQSRSPT